MQDEPASGTRATTDANQMLSLTATAPAVGVTTKEEHMKKIFIPFSVTDAGSLSNVLKYVGPKPDVQGKPAGRYQGFKDSDFVYAPKKFTGKY
jgi:hypothetical protein